MSQPTASREYYSIGEVCDLLGLKAHVLRYWETQFPQLRPAKNRSGNRVYQARQIKLIALLKRLLHEELYTVAGARRHLEQLRRKGELAPAVKRALDDEMIELLQRELLALREVLAGSERSDADTDNE